MYDYTIYYKQQLPINSSWSCYKKYDLFISAYNSSERVSKVFDKIESDKKIWLIFPEYGYDENELLIDGKYYYCIESSEGEQITSIFKDIDINDFKSCSICVDMTGFIHPQLAFLLKFLYLNGAVKIDIIYSEPMQYIKKENTSFSDGNIFEVRQIMGFEGIHSRNTSRDLLILGSGYDHNLIKSVCNSKEHARTIQLVGFPSLRPDMYQENILQMALASDALGGESIRKPLFSPANDPFVTATVLSEYIDSIQKKNGITNLYLCPMSTKPHTLGFILYYIKECQELPVSIIFPFYSKNEKQTDIGVNRIWKYNVEF